MPFFLLEHKYHFIYLRIYKKKKKAISNKKERNFLGRIGIDQNY